jgi:8-oxo-dGTP pyrophosphatase MutT (NUDIX family)
MLTRQASRLLLIDDARRVLLFKYEDGGGTWWATPGGGLEESENFEEAGRREAEEELGLTDFSLEQLWERTAEFQSRGKAIRQTERFFLVHVRGGNLMPGEGVREAHALEGILAVRWWQPSEISATTERVFPEDLHARLQEIWGRKRSGRHGESSSGVVPTA